MYNPLPQSTPEMENVLDKIMKMKKEYSLFQRKEWPMVLELIRK